MKLSQMSKENLHVKGIPTHMHDSIINYYENGWNPGSFLSAVINNNLKGAVGAADDINKYCLFNYIMWFYNDAPSGTWGYKGAVDDWVINFKKDEKNA